MMSTRDSARLAACSAVLAATAGALWMGTADARTGAPVGAPGASVSAPTGAIQRHDVAAALDEQGRGAHAKTFTGIALEKGRVHLWATSLGAARAIIADAQRDHPALDIGVVDIAVGRWSRSQLDAAARALMTSSTARSLGVQSVAPRVDGSGLHVTLLAEQPGGGRATNLPAAIVALTRAAGIPVTGTISGAITAA